MAVLTRATRTALLLCSVIAICISFHGVVGSTDDVTTGTPSSDPAGREGGAQGVNEQNNWSPVPMYELLKRKELYPLYESNTKFLQAIQPRFITELRNLFDFQNLTKTGENFQREWKDVVLYLLGFAICAGVGVLLLIFVPLIGCFIGCCRCSGKCGGKVNPRDGQSSDCGRCCCGFLLFACLGFVLSGGILMVVLSTDINQQLTGPTSVFDNASGSFQGLASYSEESVQELQTSTLVRYQTTSSGVFIQLNGIIPQVEKEINASSQLEALQTFADSVSPMEASAVAVENLTDTYNTKQNDFSEKLNKTRDSVSDPLSQCSDTSCNEAQNAIDKLTVEADFNGVELTNLIGLLSNVASQNVSGAVAEGISQYNQVFVSANESLQIEITKAESQSKEVEKSIESLITDVNKTIDPQIFLNISRDIKQVKESYAVNNVYLHIPFWVLLSLGVLVLVVALFYYIGLMYGFCGSRPDEKHPPCCSWKTGATWLLVGLILTYLFYCILMLVLVTAFLSGGALYTEVCRHAYDLPNSPVRSFIDDAIQSNINFTLSVTDTYLDCANNKSLYVALKLEQNGVNLTSIINMDQINSAVDAIKDVNITITPMTLLNANVKEALIQLGQEMDTVSEQVQVWIDETNKVVINGNLTEASELLDLAANVVPANSSSILTEAADALRNLSHTEEILNNMKGNLHKELNTLKGYLSQNITAILEGLEQAEWILNNTASELVKNITTQTAESVKVTISVNVDEITYDVQSEVGRCRPVYDSLSGLINSGCVQTLYPLNAYAFSLGMVLIFILPAILCAFKLMSLYRKTRSHAAIEDSDRDLYMAYQDDNHYTSGSKEAQNDMLLHRVNRPRSDYIAMADNPVFQDDEANVYHIPRAVIRSGTRVLPTKPAAPDERYFYAMPTRGYDDRPPPRYTATARTEV